MNVRRIQKPPMKPPAGGFPFAAAAYRHFGLKSDPLSTLALQDSNLHCFVGRASLIRQARSSILSLSNLGLAGVEGVGKSSLLRRLRSLVPKGFLPVNISVPLDDAAFFLTEFLGELSLTLPSLRGAQPRAYRRESQKDPLSKKLLYSSLKTIMTRSKKPFVVFVDDLEKIKGDRIRHLTRSERTLQLLEELKPLLELPNACFVVSLHEEFYSRVAGVVREGSDPTVLGLFTEVLRVEPFTNEDMEKILFERLRGAGFKGDLSLFLEEEALTLALSMAGGNPRRFLYLLSRAMYKGFERGGNRVEFQDLYGVLNEHLGLDLVSKKLLYFLAKSGRAVAANPDFQAFMGLDMVSLARRLEALSKNRLVEIVDYAEGSKVYGLPRLKPPFPPGPSLGRELPGEIEMTYTLSE